MSVLLFSEKNNINDYAVLNNEIQPPKLVLNNSPNKSNNLCNFFQMDNLIYLMNAFEN